MSLSTAIARQLVAKFEDEFIKRSEQVLERRVMLFSELDSLFPLPQDACQDSGSNVTVLVRSYLNWTAHQYADLYTSLTSLQAVDWYFLDQNFRVHVRKLGKLSEAMFNLERHINRLDNEFNDKIKLHPHLLPGILQREVSPATYEPFCQALEQELESLNEDDRWEFSRFAYAVQNAYEGLVLPANTPLFSGKTKQVARASFLDLAKQAYEKAKSS